MNKNKRNMHKYSQKNLDNREKTSYNMQGD